MKCMQHTATALLAALILAGAAVAQTVRYSYSGDGSEVIDSTTGLVWRRCAEGMAWNGTACTGVFTAYTHEQALAHARTQSGWRLPTVKELGSIVDRRGTVMAIDSTVFPATPYRLFWSSSPVVGDSGSAWCVSFGDGYVDGRPRSTLIPVRLVRAIASDR